MAAALWTDDGDSRSEVSSLGLDLNVDDVDSPLPPSSPGSTIAASSDISNSRSERSNNDPKDGTSSSAEDKICISAHASGYESGEDDDTEGESEVDEVITLDDDDDDIQQKDTSAPTPTELVCYRCPSKRVGTFKDEKKFWVHVKRHMFGEHFSCQTCGRPFTKLSYCISHEIRVHHQLFDYEGRDPVILLAKKYVQEKLKRKAQVEADRSTKPEAGNGNTQFSSNNETLSENEKTDGNETDPEDPKFYENQVFPSTALTCYRGPPVKHLIQCYEIHLNYAPRRDCSETTEIAEAAIRQHLFNVQNNWDTYKLGEFSKMRAPGDGNNNGKKKTSRQSAKRNRSPERESGHNSENKPKAKRRRVIYITTSDSDSEESEEEGGNPCDVNYHPNKGKEIREKVKVVDTEKVPSQMKTIRRRTGTNRKPGMGLPAVWNSQTRVCSKCTYAWRTHEDLRLHRDCFHPTVSLPDLISVSTSPKRRTTKMSPRKKQDQKNRTIKYGKYGKRPPATISPIRESFPSPDATFTKKERFLHNIGLSQNLRLQLHQNHSSIKTCDFKLKNCYVELNRLTEAELASYTTSSPTGLSLDLDDFLLDV